jgi:hypothetical protein
LNQALKSAQTTAVATFTVPAKLQLALAKDAALGKDSTKDLLKLKAAILKFIRTHKHNIAGAHRRVQPARPSTTSSARRRRRRWAASNRSTLRDSQESPRVDAAQRKALRAALSQVGPGGTVPGDGDGRLRPDHRPGRQAQTQTPPSAQSSEDFGCGVGGGTGGVVIHDNQPITIYLDGKVIARSTTRHQHKRSRRKVLRHQRRGPNAGGSRSGLRSTTNMTQQQHL